MFNELFSKTKSRKTGRKPMKCNFTGPNPAGDCRECGEPAEPGAKRLCINCAIEAGAQPVPSDPKESEKKEEK